MKPQTIKWIDRRVGTLLCWFFSVFTRFVRPSNKATQKLLFIKLIEQGASVLAYTALKDAVNKYGRDNVYFLVFKENRPILDLLNILKEENIIEIDQDTFSGFIADLIRAILQLRRLRIDSCVDMEFFSRASAIIAYLSGAKKRVGLHSFTSEHPYRGALITHKIHYNPYVHVSAYYKMLVAALEEEPLNEPRLKTPINDFKTELPRIKLSDDLKQRVIQQLGIDPSRKIILLNPNASDMLPLRKWPLEQFKRLLDMLLSHYPDAQIAFTGVEAERQNIETLIKGINSDLIINAAGRTTLDELMALYDISNVLVTNDSGPAHFASMFNTNVVVLFGPETPRLFAPKGEHIHIVYKELACSPCVNVFNHRFSPCKDNVCMKTITAEEVFKTVKKIVK